MNIDLHKSLLIAISYISMPVIFFSAIEFIGYGNSISIGLFVLVLGLNFLGALIVFFYIEKKYMLEIGC